MGTLCVNTQAPYLPPGIYRAVPRVPCVISACGLQTELQSEVVEGSPEGKREYQAAERAWLLTHLTGVLSTPRQETTIAQN